MIEAEFLFLGTGSSMGVPVVGCDCVTCQSKSAFDKRLRSSALITANGKKVLIDCGPDFRQQTLLYGLKNLDAMILTHPHFDHIGGLDDLRAFFFMRKDPLPCFLSTYTAEDIKKRFDYIFKERKSSALTTAMVMPKIKFHEFLHDRGEVEIAGLKVKYLSYTQTGMPVNGLLLGNLAYISDIKEFPETIFDDLRGIDTLIISALRSIPSLMHFTIDDAVAFSKKTSAKHTFLTHVAHEVLHEKTNASLPSNIQIAYDGLKLNFLI